MQKPLRKIVGVELVALYSTQVDFDLKVKGWRPLHYAAARGSVDAVRLLLDAGADPNARNDLGQTPIHLAIEHWAGADVIKMLIEAGAKLWARDYEGHDIMYYVKPMRRLELAKELADQLYKKNRAVGLALKCSTRKLRELLKAGLDQESKDQAVFFAGCPQVVRLLVKHGANVGARDETGATPLHYVEDPGTAQALLAKGADTGARDNAGNTPLHFARNGAVAGLLIEHGADVNAKNAQGMTPLDTCGNVEAAKELVLAGAELDSFYSRAVKKRIHVETGPGQFEVYELDIRDAPSEMLLDDEQAVRDEYERMLLDFIDDDNVCAFEFLTPNGLDPSIQVRGRSLVDWAKYYGASERMIEVLQDYSEPISEEEQQEMRAFQRPVHDCLQIVINVMEDYESMPFPGGTAIILENPEVDLYRRFDDGETIFHRLVRYFEPEAFESLWMGGCMDSFRDSAGNTPLHALLLAERAAVLDGQADEDLHKRAARLVEILIDTDLGSWCDPNARNDMGDTPLFMVGSVDTLHALVEAGRAAHNPVDVNAKNKRGDTALFHVLTPAIARDLISLGVDIDHVNNLGDTALAWIQDDEVKKVLIDAGAEPEKGGLPHGLTPLHGALNAETALELIERGADIAARSDYGDTPLHLAVLWENLDVAGLLIEHGADVNAGTT